MAPGRARRLAAARRIRPSALSAALVSSSGAK
jgi:hypothetical protein